MLFTSLDYLVLLAAVWSIYWLLPSVRFQNLLLLVASYIFYGYVHPWFCLLIASAALFNYGCARLMDASPRRRRMLLRIGIVANLVLLGVFKYLNFFFDGVRAGLAAIGLDVPHVVLTLALPAGISFYTFLNIGYLVDVGRGHVPACRSLLNFALFDSFFPQVVSGPIERARHLLPQIESRRNWRWEFIASAFPLLLQGLLTKMVIADNIAVYVDKIFMMRRPSWALLAVGTVAFAVQILADFSGYTDIARGSARLLGFDLFENFNKPYAAVSPSDFWRRWHMSLSSWLRDYLFLPISYGIMRRIEADRVLFIKTESFAYVAGTLLTMFLAGLWHGASWNFICWGLYYGVLMAVYHLAGFKGNWRPRGIKAAAAWTVMSLLTLAGWALFRSPSLGWLSSALTVPRFGFSGEPLLASVMVLGLTAAYSLPWLLVPLQNRLAADRPVARAALHACILLIIVVFHRGQSQDFIYFQF